MRTSTVLWTGAIAMTAISAATLALAGWDQPKPAAPAAAQPAARPADPPEKFDLAKLAFLSGRWSHKDDQGLTEEHWSDPAGNSIMGMFRWCKPDGTPAMFEILAITAERDEGEAEAVFLRLRHFSPKLAAKEEKDQPMTLRLDKLDGRSAVFVAHAHAGALKSVSYRCPTPDTLDIEVAFADESKRPPLVFNLKREKPPR